MFGSVVWKKALYVLSKDLKQSIMEPTFWRIDTKRNFYKVLIYVFPALYLILGFYFRQVFGNLSLRSVDPEYIHFVSGLCVSTGKFSLANIDQPASVLHLLLAGIFRVTYLFRPHNVPYFQDVIRNSDMYLAVGNLVITTIIVVTMLWAGKAVFKISKNIVYAVMIQTAPFLMNIWYDISGRIYTELLFVVPIFILVVLLLKEIYDESGNQNRRILYYGLAVGIGFSLKMTFLPFLILPLFLIKDLTGKLKYLFYAVVSFGLLSLPVIFQLNRFWNWFTGLFLHSGTYQGGAKTVINGAMFFKNLKELFVSKHNFFFALLLLAIFFLLTFIVRKGKSVLKRIDLGLITALAGMIFITSKHFEIRYFVPALLLFPFLLILLREHALQYINNKYLNLLMSLLLVVIIGYQIKQEIPYIRIVSKSVSSQMAARIETRNVVKTLTKDSYKIIVSQDYGCPYQEYAIMYGFSMAGQNWPGYKEKLNKIYPDTYQYFTWSDTMKYWGQKFNADSVLASGKPVYLYLQKNTKELYDKTINKLFKSDSGLLLTRKLIFQNPVNHEAILQLFLSKKKKNN